VYSYQDFQRHSHILLVSLQSVTEHLAVAGAVALLVILSLLFATEKTWKQGARKEGMAVQLPQESQSEKEKVFQ